MLFWYFKIMKNLLLFGLTFQDIFYKIMIVYFAQN